MSSYTEDNNQIPEMRQNLELLQELTFLSSFPLQALKLLALVAERTLFPAGEIIFEQGDDDGRAYLILQGELNLFRKVEANDVEVQQFHDGDFLGSFSLFGSLPSLFTMKAMVETSVLTINREHFSKILEQFPETSTLSLTYLVRELHQWERKNLNQAPGSCTKQAGATIL
jgi:CRP/FNR family cyclic AMP-dependent transcriptional regulator